MRRRAARRPSARRRGARRLAAAAYAVCAGAGLLLGALEGPALLERLTPEGLRLERIFVAGQARVSTPGLVQAAGLQAGQPVASLDASAIRARLRTHPWVRDARVAALPTGRVLVAVDEREPRALALVAGRWHFVDEGGDAFALAPEATALPRLVGAPAPAAPTVAELRQGVSLLDALARSGLPEARAVRLWGGDAQALPELLMDLGGAAPCRVILGGGDPAPRLERLARLLAADLPQTRAARAIDLRFGEQLVLRSEEWSEGNRVLRSDG